jgi:hypothetical protein
MTRARLLSLASLLVCLACDDGGPDGDPDAGRMDAGPARRDAGPRWVSPDCNPETGIECDGDWAGRCTPACGEEECCSPQRGAFDCVPRNSDGSCPAANIFVDTTRIAGQADVVWGFFDANSCAIAEGCVDGPGWRRLLSFGTWTPNTGEADLYLGVPDESNPQFMYSECHDHFHFDGYAEYELRAIDGTVAAEGHKQAFCLLDFYRYPGTDDRGYVYTCENQGIQRGWQDVYDTDLDCQWVDVTDVAPGNYTLHIDLNVDHTLLESDYADNAADIAVTIPADEPVNVTIACPGQRQGDQRDCGWTRAPQLYRCNAGDAVRVGCTNTCEAPIGSCDDDSGCGSEEDPDRCSLTSFTCPDGGATFQVFTAPWDTLDGDSQCNFAVEGAVPAP